MSTYENYKDEMTKALLEYGEEKHKEGFIDGYRHALDDFLRGLKHSHLTPDELYNKLKLWED